MSILFRTIVDYNLLFEGLPPHFADDVVNGGKRGAAVRIPHLHNDKSHMNSKNGCRIRGTCGAVFFYI